MKRIFLIAVIFISLSACKKEMPGNPEPLVLERDFPWFPVELRMDDFTKNYSKFADWESLINPESIQVTYELTDTTNLSYTTTLTCYEKITRPQTNTEIYNYAYRLNTTTNYIGGYITYNGPRYKSPSNPLIKPHFLEITYGQFAITDIVKYSTFSPFHCTKTVYSIFFKNEFYPVEYVFE